MSEIIIRVNDREVTVPSGTTLLNAVMDAGIPIDTACGGQARCHLCRVTITEGREQLPTAEAIEYKALGNVLIAQGMRLACQVEITAPMSVTVPEPRPKRRRGPPPRPPKAPGSADQRRARDEQKPRRARDEQKPRRARDERESQRREQPDTRAPQRPRDEQSRDTVSSDEAPKKKRRRRRPRRRRKKSEGT